MIGSYANRLRAAVAERRAAPPIRLLPWLALLILADAVLVFLAILVGFDEAIFSQF